MIDVPTEQIILRSRPMFTPTESFTLLGTRSIAGGNVPPLSEPTLEMAEMTSAEVADLQRDPGVMAVASPMPLKLIEPLDANDAQPTANNNTWGIEAVDAHTSPFDGAGITVAVLDTGIRPNHDAFHGINLTQRNFTTGPADDINGHGTHCAGTIFGRDVNGLRIGVARGVTNALIGKVLGPGGGSSATLANAINWAYESGANVISMSLGIDFPGYVAHLIGNVGLQAEPATSLALEQYRANVNLFSSLSHLLAQSNAFSQAAIIVAASGNESDRPNYEIAVAPPAAGHGIISVGALRKLNGGAFGVAAFSNTHCNLSGPGVGVISAWIGGDSDLHTISGTSMATPHVAGCAALWAQRQQQITGSLTNENLAARTLACAEFIPGARFSDIGNGLAKAPQ